MKLKTLAAVTLVVLGCRLASAQIGATFSFWDSSGDINYCDYLVITYNSGGVVAGYDDLNEPEEQGGCGQTENAPVVGFDATTPAHAAVAHGEGVVVGDAIYDAEGDGYTGLQWTLWLSNKFSKRSKYGVFSGPYGWIGVAGSSSGFYFGDNYGYLTPRPPQEKGKVAGTIAGKLPERLRK